MVDKPKIRPTEPLAEDDLNKESARLQGAAADSLRFNLQIAADTWGGTAEAVARGFRAFRNEMDEAASTRRGLFNGIVDGLFSGNATFLEHMARTSRDVASAVKNSEAGRIESARESLDYDRLADLVAKRLGKRNSEP